MFFRFALALLGLAAVCRAQNAPPITIDSTEEQIRQAVGTARMGKKLTPKTWPNGARVAVCLSFDVDNELLQRANPLPVPLSVGEYGATTGLPRILSLLDRHRVPAFPLLDADQNGYRPAPHRLDPDLRRIDSDRSRRPRSLLGALQELGPCRSC